MLAVSQFIQEQDVSGAGVRYRFRARQGRICRDSLREAGCGYPAALPGGLRLSGFIKVQR